MPNVNTGQARALITSAAYAMGRSTGRLRPVAGGGASRVGPVLGGAAVAALWATIYAWTNLSKLRRGTISKKTAAKRTAAESVGIGLATGMGIATVNAVRTSALATLSPALAPFLAGTAVTGAAMAAWDRMMTKRSPDPRKAVVAETRTQANVPST